MLGSEPSAFRWRRPGEKWQYADWGHYMDGQVNDLVRRGCEVELMDGRGAIKAAPPSTATKQQSHGAGGALGVRV